MITEHDIEYMVNDINELTPVYAQTLRDSLLTLCKAIDDKLNGRIVHLTIKPRHGADYVYANWTDDSGSHVEYIGKWQPAAELDAMLEALQSPTEAEFRLTDKKAAGLAKTHWVATYRGGEGVNGGNVEFKYNQTAYQAAMATYFERRDLLKNPLAKIAQTDRQAGILKLERLQEQGFYIKPL
jgi:hypothetical protein